MEKPSTGREEEAKTFAPIIIVDLYLAKENKKKTTTTEMNSDNCHLPCGVGVK
jgi:hypothetical protein